MVCLLLTDANTIQVQKCAKKDHSNGYYFDLANRNDLAVLEPNIDFSVCRFDCI